MARSRENTIEEKSDKGPDRLSGLANDLLQYSIFSFLSSSALASLGKTSERFANFPNCKIGIEFLSLVSHGQKDHVEALLSQDPDLLFFADTVLDPSGRKVQGTALEIALGAEDISLYSNNGTTLLGEGMVEMLQRHLRKLPNGEAEIARQTLKQFPAGWEEEEEKRHKEDLKALRKVRYAIDASSSDEDCKAAILEFKKHVTPQKTITTGRHWNAKLLQAAFDMGRREYFKDSRKNNLFYDQVVGYIQALAPANYAMAQAQGLIYLFIQDEGFKRNLTYKNHSSLAYYPQHKRERFQLGANSWVDCCFGRPAQGSRILTPGSHSQSFFKSYVEVKTKVLKKFLPQSDNHRNRPSCVMM